MHLSSLHRYAVLLHLSGNSPLNEKYCKLRTEALVLSRPQDRHETKTSSLSAYYLWSPYVIGQTIIFLPCGFFLSSFFFFLA